MATYAYIRRARSERSLLELRSRISQGRVVDHWFIDETQHSLHHHAKLPGFMDMLESACCGDHLIVPSIHELGRDTIEVHDAVESLHRIGVQLTTLEEGFDLFGPSSSGLLNMLSSMARLERSKIRTRQQQGFQRARATGRKLGAPKKIDDQLIYEWRCRTGATIKEAAEHFDISISGVKRACAKWKDVPLQMQSNGSLIAVASTAQ